MKTKTILSTIIIFVLILNFAASTTNLTKNFEKTNKSQIQKFEENLTKEEMIETKEEINKSQVEKNIELKILNNSIKNPDESKTNITPYKNFTNITVKENENFTNITVKENENFTNITVKENENFTNITVKENENKTYLNLDNLTTNKIIKKSSNSEVKNPEKTDKISEENKETEKTKIILYKDGQKEIEGEIPKTHSGNIEKTEEILNQEDWEKEVTIKSNEHLETPLTVYSDIQEIPFSQKKLIKINWENEEKEIQIKEYLDTNENGKIDRISWIVPHLSTQIFKIMIESEFPTDSSEILIGVTKPQDSSTQTNPINFGLEINYSQKNNLNCSLEINGVIEKYFDASDTKITLTKNLNNGDYNWKIYCEDPINSKDNLTTGSFKIDEGFSISNLEETYLPSESINPLLNSNNPTNVTVKLRNYATQEIKATNFINNIQNATTGIDFSDLSEGIYLLEVNFESLEETINENKTFSIIKAEIDFSSESIKEGEEKTINVDINSPLQEITSLIIDFGDGSSNISYSTTNGKSKNISFIHKYTKKGNYDIKMTTIIGGKSKIIEKTNLIVEENEEKSSGSPPQINLIYPMNKMRLKASEVDFTFQVKDDGTISKCIYDLYKEIGGLKTQEYTETRTNIEENQDIIISLTSFEEGNYSWYVTCTDDESNTEQKTSDFELYLYNHPNEKEINELLENLEDFLEKEKNRSLDEQEVLEDLGILKDLQYYQKRLLQINQDLGTNLNYIADQTLKDKRKRETLNELDEIKLKIPLDMKIIESKEYIKNSLTQELEGIINNYLNSKKIELTKKELNQLINQNKELQNKITVSTNVKKIELEYSNGKEIITLVTKKINNKDNSSMILESLPSQITEELTFKTDKKDITENLYELEGIDKKIVYYFKEDIDIEDIKKIDTLAFKQFPVNKNFITGLSISNPDISSNSLVISIVGSILLIGIIYVVRGRGRRKYKKNKNLRKASIKIRKANELIKEKDYDTAKDKYNELKEIYPLVPSKVKPSLYKKIERIRIVLDKKEIAKFIKEFEKASKEGRKEDKQRLYNLIQEKYKVLPKKYQEKAYEKLIEYL